MTFRGSGAELLEEGLCVREVRAESRREEENIKERLACC